MRSLLCTILILGFVSCHQPPAITVGPADEGGYIVSTKQLIRPAGQSLEFPGRPVDMLLSPDARHLFIKENRGILVIDAQNFSILQQIPFPDKEGASIYGLAIDASGKHLYATTTTNHFCEADIAETGKITWNRRVQIKGPGSKANSHPTGIAISSDGTKAFVCASINNTLAIIDLKTFKLDSQINTGVAPYSVVLSTDQKTAYISNWGGRRAKPGDKTTTSSDTPVIVDDRGVSTSGTISIINLADRKETKQIATGLHPADMKLSRGGSHLFVANSNSDTITIIDLTKERVSQTIIARPDSELPFGSLTNALAISPLNDQLYFANGGNNAAGILNNASTGKATITGFIPTGWFPGALACDGKHLYIANIKGNGSRNPKPNQNGWSPYQYQGTINKVPLPDAQTLATYSAQVIADARIPETLAGLERSSFKAQAVPVPLKAGEPSVFEHIIYVIKENRTYDQVFGKIGKGNSDPSLCIFGPDITPNHHALANQFVLLDNFYCNGVISADGHAWVSQGIAINYLERSFGGWTRSYPFAGDDPLAVASTGFIWDNVLMHGLSFRNYGEMVYTNLIPANTSFSDVHKNWRSDVRKVRFENKIAIDTVDRHTCPDYPGWNMNIPDNLRMDVFLKEFESARKSGRWYNFMTVYLPNDHTSGTAANHPTPAAHVADNDLALGRLVEAVSKSRYWANTCIFVIEDDPQNGFDHVDGHRSICLVISPYTKRKQIVSNFYNQTSVLHTMEMMLGIPPMNQMDAAAPIMRECFTTKPDYTPYTALPVNIPLDQMNKPKSALAGMELQLANQSEAQDLSKPDRADENTLNRILWHAVKGVNAPYPAEWAGAHGRGLKALKLAPTKDDDDDDDDDKKK